MTPTRNSTISTAQPPVMTPDGGISLEVLLNFDASGVSRDQWDSLVATQCGNLYMTFDWCRIWWRFYGRGRELRILVFRHKDELVAILPMFLETLWLGPVWCKVAKLVGGDSSIQLCNPPIRDDSLAPVLKAAVEYLIGASRCDLVVFSPLSAHYSHIQGVRAACRHDIPNAGLITDRVIDCHSGFVLPPSFELFLAGLDKNRRANYKRDLNLLNKSFRVTTDTIADPARLSEEFPAFCRMHTYQWNAEGMRGHFQDWPKSYEFNLDLLKEHSKHGRVRLYRLLLNGEPVSYQFAFLFNGALFWRLPARVAGEQWGRYGLGRMGLAKLIESAIGEGVNFIEGGQGHYDYKIQMGATEYPVQALAMVSGKAAAATRVHLMKIFSVGLNIAYYKILFRRVYPRLPFLSKQLSRVWIRSRF